MKRNARSIDVWNMGWTRRLAAVSFAVPVVALVGGCGGGEELLDAIGGATGDGGKRVKLTGPIMGEERMICIDSPPRLLRLRCSRRSTNTCSRRFAGIPVRPTRRPPSTSRLRTTGRAVIACRLT